MKGKAPTKMEKIFIIASLLTALCGFSSAQSAVRVEPADSVGPRTLEPQTRTAVIQDYLQAWQSLSQALEHNRADSLDPDFVGVAREKLQDTIREQEKLGLQTRYSDSAHDIQLSFYSPEGLSVALLDTVEYTVQILDHNKLQSTQHIRARYIAVLSPTEVRWKVRIFQAVSE